MREAKLQGATLVGANLHGADLTSAHLEGANLMNLRLDEHTRLENVFWGESFVSFLEREGLYKKAESSYRQLKTLLIVV